jgi:hypothetical protein
MGRIVRCKEREQNNDRTEDILASLGKLHADLSVAQQAIGYLQGSTSKMTTSPETAQRALTYLEVAMTAGQTRCQQLQRQVIEVTEYPYGREPEEVMA